MQRSHSFTRPKSWLAIDRLDLQIARISSSVVMLAGSLVLIGWMLNLEALKIVIPGSTTMKANTALCFLLAGISLNLQTRSRKLVPTRIAKGCAFAISTIGLITLCEYIFGWNLGIDEILVRDLLTNIGSNPGRMGTNTAVNFGLVGISLWLVNRHQLPPQQQQRIKLTWIAISQTLALVAGFIALQAVVGYAYNVRVFYQISIFTTAMAFQTAIVFVVLCGGILALSSDRGWMRALTSDLIGGDVARRFMPIAIVLPVLLGWLILRGYHAKFYDINFGFALMSISLVAILLGLIGLNAGILDRMDYDRIRSDDRIRLSEERLQLALESANQGIWGLDIQRQVLTWDDRCQALFGLPPTARLTYSHWLDLLHPDDRDRVAAAVITATREVSGFNQEYRTIHPDGTICWILSQGRSYHNAAGEPDRLLGTMMDITDRKRTERELRESQERLQIGMEVAGVGLARVDYASNLVALSPEAAVLYGVSADGGFITREQLHDTFHPDERAKLEVSIAQAIDPDGKGWFIQDHPIVLPSGEVRCLSVRKQVFFDRSGAVAHPSYAILAAIDITELKQAQTDLKERNQELDSFVYIVAHDLKAPLRAISNLAQWLEDDLEAVLTTDTQPQMVLLRSRVRRMEATIDGLLDYARVGRVHGKIEPVVVTELLAEVIDSIDPPPTFTIVIDPDLPVFDTKWLCLSQVFTNLISNGIKHHHRADGSIHISATQRGDFYEFIVADNGPGIAPEQHDKVFEIFQAVNPQNRSDSTGIGLAIVKKVIEADGGTIWLESQLGEGTKFYFTLPILVSN